MAQRIASHVDERLGVGVRAYLQCAPWTSHRMSRVPGWGIRPENMGSSPSRFGPLGVHHMRSVAV
jgi:hypothetical protein